MCGIVKLMWLFHFAVKGRGVLLTETERPGSPKLPRSTSSNRQEQRMIFGCGVRPQIRATSVPVYGGFQKNLRCVTDKIPNKIPAFLYSFFLYLVTIKHIY